MVPCGPYGASTSARAHPVFHAVLWSIDFGRYSPGLPRSPPERRFWSLFFGPSKESSGALTSVGTLRAFPGVLWSIDLGRYSWGLPRSPLEHRLR
ncbi:hypothetical protein MRX96_040762 [Rhipicephalus microplus]